MTNKESLRPNPHPSPYTSFLPFCTSFHCLSQNFSKRLVQVIQHNSSSEEFRRYRANTHPRYSSFTDEICGCSHFRNERNRPWFGNRAVKLTFDSRRGIAPVIMAKGGHSVSEKGFHARDPFFLVRFLCSKTKDLPPQQGDLRLLPSLDQWRMYAQALEVVPSGPTKQART